MGSSSIEENDNGKSNGKVLVLVALISLASFIISIVCLLLIPAESRVRFPLAVVFLVIPLILMVRYKKQICSDSRRGSNSEQQHERQQIEIQVPKGFRVLNVSQTREEEIQIERRENSEGPQSPKEPCRTRTESLDLDEISVVK